MLAIFQGIASFIDELVNWLKSADLESLRVFIKSFESFDPIILLVLAILGFTLAFLGRRIFIVPYTGAWIMMGYYMGYKFGISAGKDIYGIELGLLCAILLPIISIKARKVFLFIISMLVTMFLCVYLFSSLNIGKDLNILDPYFFITGVIVALIALKFENQLIIAVTSLMGSFLSAIAIAGYLSDKFPNVPETLILILLVVLILLASLGIQFKYYSKERIEQETREEFLPPKGKNANKSNK